MGVEEENTINSMRNLRTENLIHIYSDSKSLEYVWRRNHNEMNEKNEENVLFCEGQTNKA